MQLLRYLHHGRVPFSAQHTQPMAWERVTLTDSHLSTAATTAAAVRSAIVKKNTALADRVITELFTRIINAKGAIASRVLNEADEHTRRSECRR